MATTVPYTFKYSTDKLNIDDVILSLKGQKEVISSALDVIERLNPSFTIVSSEIYIETIKTDSKKFEYMIQVYEEYQDEIKEFVIDKIEGHTGVDVPAELEGFVVLTSLAVLYFVSRYAYDKVSGGKKDGQPSINNSYNNTITVLGDMTGVSIGEVDKAIQAAIPKPRRKFLTQKVADIFRPARADAGSTIAVGGDKIVGSKEIYEFPTDAEIMGIVDSHTINEDNLLIEIRATDKDRNKSGWGAQIVGNAKYPKRLPMDLYPDLNAADLASKNQVFGDMVIDVSVDFEGNIKPKKIHLLRYRDVSKDAT